MYLTYHLNGGGGLVDCIVFIEAQFNHRTCHVRSTFESSKSDIS